MSAQCKVELCFLCWSSVAQPQPLTIHFIQHFTITIMVHHISHTPTHHYLKYLHLRGATHCDRLWTLCGGSCWGAAGVLGQAVRTCGH